MARLATPVFENLPPFELGKVCPLREGKDAVLLCNGIMVNECLNAAELLAARGKDVAVVNVHTLKPFDEDGVRALAAKYRQVYTVEEHSVIGGLGDATAAAIVNMDGVRLTKLGVQDRFGQSGKPAALLREYGLDAESIAAAVLA